MKLSNNLEIKTLRFQAEGYFFAKKEEEEEE